MEIWLQVTACCCCCCSLLGLTKQNSGYCEAPHHAALRAQAEKEAAYRPRGKESANAGEEEEEGGEGLLPKRKNEDEPAAAAPKEGVHDDRVEAVVRDGGGGGRGGYSCKFFFTVRK